MNNEIGIIAVGGYNEMGRNMTAIVYKNDIVILDMGIRLDRVQIYDEVEIDKMHSLELIEMGAIPDDTIMKEVDGTVKAIICTHGHLDHIGAIPKLAHRYNAPIIGTPYTIELIKSQINDEKKFRVMNPLIQLKYNKKYKISENISLELIEITHSIIDSSLAVLYTPIGSIVYACDFKLDRSPVIGNPPNFKLLKNIGESGVLALITETTNSTKKGKTPSEKIAKELLKDVLLGSEDLNTGIIVTTFASHISRLKTIFEISNEMNRIPIFLGRSMEKYLRSAISLDYIDFPKNIEIYGQRKDIDKALKKVMLEGKNKYLLIVTGHQGESGSTLTRIANYETPFKFDRGDKVIFSANIIPSPITVANRNALDTKLKMQGVRIYEDVHVSGHAYREDHWEFLQMLKPLHIIPTHGDIIMHGSYLEMAEEAGYILGESIHLLRNGEILFLEK